MSPLRRQLGTNVWLFRSFVLLLYGSIVALSLDVHRTLPRPVISIFESVDNGLTFADNGSDGDQICLPPLRFIGTGCFRSAAIFEDGRRQILRYAIIVTFVLRK